MSDTAPTLSPEAQEEIEKLEQVTKRGFNLKERLENRGLRKETVVLYLDEELGPELGWAYPIKNQIGEQIAWERSGVIGEIDETENGKMQAHAAYNMNVAKMSEEDAAEAKKNLDAIVAGFDKQLKTLYKRKDELIAKLTETGLTVKLRAVPPIIQKDTARRARKTLGIEEKGIPEDRKDVYYIAEQAHLMTVMVQSVTDNSTNISNDEMTYDDAIAMMDFLPPGQWERLNDAIFRVQFTDAISRSIESQEDFS